ncbi:thiaminase-2 [Variibacter gotjawalensis]|uniref:Aminopyrimidine aminohydrolase n=1 Tax=Variibacter gotjawalensis TaxID=1333996 RepID=A0A0S3PT86_9BRAD|nr:thiaminase II [Variibacter gotjawalensis]NIK49448.1 thiaminase/transcriptional activator TenA [Variibacter gotjawalensis]RZS51300.1 thiaminase/transcriptional activator TenA [Variibacter gotjawalensis]BAT59133.1 thiaminase-2 [Variibacter gotjawalensis]
MDIFERFKTAARADWDSYVDHAFVRQMADGTLPQPAFREYLVQDYLFLIQFARANALAIYKSRTLADMRKAQSAVSAILDVEMDLHVRLCARWGISAQELEATPEHAATVAYTRFVLDRGAAGDLLELNVALSPCVIGYAEIGRTLLPKISPDHPYAEWIGEYGGDAYQEIAANARAYLDDLARRFMPANRFDELASLFAAASRLEADFWQMGLDAKD